MQDRPVCLNCHEPIEDPVSLVFEAPCGHEDCPSAAWHGLCLMEWREQGREDQRRFLRFVSELIGRAREMGVPFPGSEE